MHDVDLGGEPQQSSSPREERESRNQIPQAKKDRTSNDAEGGWIRHGGRLVIKGVFSPNNGNKKD